MVAKFELTKLILNKDETLVETVATVRCKEKLEVPHAYVVTRLITDRYGPEVKGKTAETATSRTT